MPPGQPIALSSGCNPAREATTPGRYIDDAVLARIWPTHHESVHFYGTHSVDVDGELAKLGACGYRPLHAIIATERS
jgi:hypothetical protein